MHFLPRINKPRSYNKMRMDLIHLYKDLREFQERNEKREIKLLAESGRWEAAAELARREAKRAKALADGLKKILKEVA